MKRQDLEEFLLRKGYVSDRYGNFKKTSEDGKSTRRYKMQKTSVRIERQIVYSDGSKGCWIRILSGFYSQMSITENDKLKGFK